MIWTLKVKLVSGAYAEGPCEKHLEVDSEISLYELHTAILDAIGFDNDHLFEFFIGKNYRNRFRALVDEEDYFDFNLDSAPGAAFLDIDLEEIFTELPKGMKLIYYYDFGDDWMFEITKMRGEAKKLGTRTKYPRVVKSAGKNPVQYPSFED